MVIMGLICILITCNPFKQFLNICANFFGYSLFAMVSTLCIAMNFALKIFGGLGV